MEDGYVRILTVTSNERNALQISKMIGVSAEKFEAKYNKKKSAGSLRSQTDHSEGSTPSTRAKFTAGALLSDIIPQSSGTVNEANSQNVGQSPRYTQADDDAYYRRVMAHMDAVTSDNSTGRAVPDNISAPGQTSDGLTDDEYFRMLQKFVDEGAVDDYYRTANKELTTSGSDTTSPNLEYVVSETDAQHYKPVSLDQNDVISTEYKTLPCVASKAIDYDNIYISNKLNLKRRQLHYVNTRIKKAATLVTSNADFEMPRVIICDPTELPTRTAAAYTAHDNTLRINSAITTKKGVLALPKDGACSDNHNSIYVHEMLHWADAQAYMAAHGSADGYLEANVKWARNNIDKLRNSGYNIEDISEYASWMLPQGRYDEVWTEYRVDSILGR